MIHKPVCFQNSLVDTIKQNLAGFVFFFPPKAVKIAWLDMIQETVFFHVVLGSSLTLSTEATSLEAFWVQEEGAAP